MDLDRDVTLDGIAVNGADVFRAGRDFTLDARAFDIPASHDAHRRAGVHPGDEPRRRQSLPRPDRSPHDPHES